MEILMLFALLFIVLAPFGWLWWRSISRTCPECAERIDKRAKVCRYCGYRFD